MLVLIFNKSINFTDSIIEGRLKISSVNNDGSDAVSINGVKIIRPSSPYLINMTYDTAIEKGRIILLESSEGFRLISDDA